MSLYRPFVLLLFFFFLLFTLPQSGAEALRTKAIAFASIFPQRGEEGRFEDRLLIENQMLRSQLVRVQKWIEQHRFLQEEIEHLQRIQEDGSDFFKRRGAYLSSLIEKQLQALPAQIVFCEPASWKGGVWIGVGEEENRKLGRTIISEGSPVVVGKIVVGMIDQVGENRSRVRTIFDPDLSLSVRCVREGKKEDLICRETERLAQKIRVRTDLLGAQELSDAMETFCHRLSLGEFEVGGGRYLAKGQLQGAKRPLFRGKSQILRGEGFNYAFADLEGPAHPLQGDFLEPLVKEGDLLLTTGLDGIFPPDLHVATVSRVLPLNEGEVSYCLEAKPLIGDLNALVDLFVLPPQ